MLQETPNQDESAVQLEGASAAHKGAKSRTPAAHGAEGLQSSAQVLWLHCYSFASPSVTVLQASLCTGGESVTACLPLIAQVGSTAHNSAQQARKKADEIALKCAAADDAGNAAQNEVEKWDATISDLIKNLNSAHKNRAAAFQMTQNKSARRCALDDELEHATESTGSVLKIIHNAKRRKFDEIGL